MQPEKQKLIHSLIMSANGHTGAINHGTALVWTNLRAHSAVHSVLVGRGCQAGDLQAGSEKVPVPWSKITMRTMSEAGLHLNSSSCSCSYLELPGRYDLALPGTWHV